MVLAGAYRQPLEARFRTTAGAGSGLTSLNVAGRRAVDLSGAHSLPLRALRGLVGRAVSFTGSLGLVALGMPPFHAPARRRYASYHC